MDQIICHDRNIVYVDFSGGSRLEAAECASDFGEYRTYLEICAATLSEEDYFDLLDAIIDPDFFLRCDEEIQEIACGYFAHVQQG